MRVEYSTRYVSWSGEERPFPPQYGRTEWDREYLVTAFIDGQKLCSLHRENCMGGRTEDHDFEDYIKRRLVQQITAIISHELLSNLNV